MVETDVERYKTIKMGTDATMNETVRKRIVAYEV